MLIIIAYDDDNDDEVVIIAHIKCILFTVINQLRWCMNIN